MNKFDRLYDLHGFLSGRRVPVATAELMHKLECSEPTVRRLIAKLRDELGAPVRFDRARGGWMYEASQDAPYELPGLWFSAPQLQALLAAHQWLAEVEPGLLGEEIAPLLKRLETLLEQRQPGGGAIRHKVKLIALAARKVEDAVFRTVAGTLADGRRLRFDYRSRSRDETRPRTVSPLRLTWYKSN